MQFFWKLEHLNHLRKFATPCKKMVKPSNEHDPLIKLVAGPVGAVVFIFQCFDRQSKKMESACSHKTLPVHTLRAFLDLNIGLRQHTGCRELRIAGPHLVDKIRSLQKQKNTGRN